MRTARKNSTTTTRIRTSGRTWPRTGGSPRSATGWRSHCRRLRSFDRRNRKSAVGMRGCMQSSTDAGHGISSWRTNREKKMKNFLFAFALLVTLSGVAVGAGDNKGPLADPSFFPIAVWLQDPANASKYKDIGINVYVGLWRGPTEKQLAELKKH